jgi:hypothetical protein
MDLKKIGFANGDKIKGGGVSCGNYTCFNKLKYIFTRFELGIYIAITNKFTTPIRRKTMAT